MTAEQHARERRIDALMLLVEFGATKDEKLDAANKLLTEVRARNAARTPAQVVQIETAKGLR